MGNPDFDLWPESHLAIGPKGRSNVSCGNCGKRFSKADTKSIFEWLGVPCKRCGVYGYLDNTVIDVREDHAHLLGQHIPTEWFHVTTRSTWHETPKDLFVHVGTKLTVAWYAAYCFDAHLARGWPLFYYRAILKPAAAEAVAPYVVKDNNDWPRWGQDIATTVPRRYLNRYELPGSISLLVRFADFASIEPMQESEFAFDKTKEI